MKNTCRLILNNFLALVVTITLYSFCYGQYENENFLFPIKPGTPNYLAANMGELRPNHFHGGYDVKTDGQIGYPVFASSDGYVSKVKVSSFGYGNVIYITHANNLKTVYAHLEKFNKPIGDFVLKNQYILQNFEVELNLGPGVLPIKRGEIIGLAGNTGGSQGPHLHYETRDTLDNVLNPTAFGFKEIKDNLTPIFQRIAFVPLDINSRINDEFERKDIVVTKVGSSFTLPSSINLFGTIGLELKAIDKKNSTHNTYGVNYIEVQVDGQTVFIHDLSSYNHEETRLINSHLNYPLLMTTGTKSERLYVADGNHLSTLRKSPPAKGRIKITDNLPHKIKVIIKDDFNNQSVLNFEVKGKPYQNVVIKPSFLPNQLSQFTILDNTLKMATKAVGDVGCSLYFKGKVLEIPASYLKAGFVTYLYDLRKGLPDSVKLGTTSKSFNFIKPIFPGVEQKVSTQEVSILFPPKSLLDTLYLQLSKEESKTGTIYNIHDKSVPLYDSIQLTINPKEEIINKSRTFIYSKNKGKPNFEGGEWKGNKIEVKTRNLGKFALLEDTIKPTIKLLSNFGNSIKFSVSDNLSGIKSFNATLDDYWVLMNYDYKRNLLWSERLDKTVPLRGDFKLEVIDNAGNITIYNIKL